MVSVRFAAPVGHRADAVLLTQSGVDRDGYAFAVQEQGRGEPMKSTAGVLAFVALGAVLWVACSGIDRQTSPEGLDQPSLASGGVPGGTEKCPDGGVKDEVGPPWSITVPVGQVINSVCVKAGSYVYVLTADGVISRNGTSCFVVDFSTSRRTVTVTNAAGHVGSICFGISNIVAYAGPAPSPSPSPS
jgi:hypothetical protein